tara:strand:- start:256 stop:468 length:213 start_codon:yes stop_codon:yes gene_type:complete
VSTTGSHHPRQAIQRLGDITLIDGVPKIPWRNVAANSEKGRDVLCSQGRSGAEDRCQRFKEWHYSRPIFT